MLYAIATSDLSRVKLGITRSADSLQKRLRQLQTGCPDKLVVVWTVEAFGRAEEQLLHRRLGHYRCRNEWFEGRILEFINPTSIFTLL
jgi:hypothetical protein